MLKGKKFKFFLPAMISLLIIAVSSTSISLFAASDTTSDFKQLNYTQLLSDMGTGWNLGNTLEASINGTPSETAWGNPTVTKDFITKVKAAGFKSIRIPVSYLSKIGPAPDYTVDAAWLNRIQEIVDYVYSQGMYAIINMHGDGYKTVAGSWLLCYADEQTSIKAKYQKVWQQIANKFINYNEHLIFESMNEEFDGDWDDPKPSDYANLNAYNQVFVDTIRQTGGNNSARWLLIPGWNTDINYTTGNYGFVIPTDNYRSSSIPSSEKRIAISVHYYSPWDFCGDNGPVTQWGEGSTNPDKAPSWGQEDYMEAQFNTMYKKFVTQGYPFMVGEYGSIDKTSSDPTNNTYRATFAKALCKTVRKYGGLPMYWDNGYNGDGGFAVFDRKTSSITQKGVIDAIMNALSTTPAFDPSVTPVLVTPTPLPSGSFTVDYDVGGSGTINLTIKNNLTTKNINGWTMEFTFPEDQKITSMWGGTYTQNGAQVTIKNADYTSKISANGGVVTLGFNVSYSSANNKPSSIIINGSAATIVGVVTTPKPTTTITPTVTKAPTATPTQIVGDINGDGTVNMADVVLIAGSFN
ncbi:MAG: cellulase family glycosylhydrolase, partial [Bacillota bacterium]|nr:cellulase family glycosylhydrolase [Bacillota bacterium]